MAARHRALQEPDRLAHRRRHRRHRRSGHHRRIADRRFRRAQGTDPDRRRARQGPHPVIAGTGGNSTRGGDRADAHSAKKSRRDRTPVGRSVLQQADAGRPVPPFPQDRGAVDLPMILYNVPVRTVADLPNDTVLRLAQVPGIIGIKDATANIERGTDLIARAPRAFAIYSRRRRDRACADAARRPRRDLGDRQRRAAGHARDVRRRAGGRRQDGARAQPAPASACTRSCSSRPTRSP